MNCNFPGQVSDTCSDFEDGLIVVNRCEFDDLVYIRLFDQEILPQPFIWFNPVRLDKRDGAGMGVCYGQVVSSLLSGNSPDLNRSIYSRTASISAMVA